MDTISLPLPSDPTHAKPVVDRSLYRPLVDVALLSCETTKRRLPHDGNLGAYFKITAELAIHANALSEARDLLTQAIPWFKSETTMDCSQLVAQCEQLVQLLGSMVDK